MNTTSPPTSPNSGKDANSANDLINLGSTTVGATEYAAMTDEIPSNPNESTRVEDRYYHSQSSGTGTTNVFSKISSAAKFKYSKQDSASEEEKDERLEKLSEILTNLAIDERPDASRKLNHSQNLVNIDLTSSKNWAEIDAVLEVLIEQEFPKSNIQIPNLKAIINVGDLEPGSRFSPGAWVEIRGADMKWKLDMITKVSKEAPADYDWNDPKNKGKEPEWTYFYQAGDERRLNEEDLRSPEQGLRHLFGSRPWIWQQWACLKLEQVLRFQEGHQHDFTTLDVQRYATELWEYWLNHPSNQEFYNHFFDVRIGDFGRSELVDHIMTPFRLMDLMTSEHEAWDFEADEDISIYTYLSLFGSGFSIPFIIIFIQISVMLILLTDSDYKRDITGEEMDEGDSQDFSILAMAIVVMFLYLVKVVPDLMVRFYNTVGTADSVHSRLTRLSHELWLQDEDRIGQKVGFKMDSFMNTTYVAILYILNIYIIVNAENALDVILNSLALEFVEKIDEMVSNSVWWDKKKRWIRAGALELVLQATLQKHCLRSAPRFSEKFDVPVSVLNGICNYNRLLFCNEVVAADDSENPRLMTKSELIKSRCKDIAIKTGNRKAIQEYKKPVAYFSNLEAIIKNCFCSSSHDSLFQRHYAYRTWSCWNQVLYFASIPNLDVLFENGEDSSFMLSQHLENIVHTPAEPFANYDDFEETEKMRFVRKFFEVLFFIDLVKSLRSSWQQNGFRRLLFHFFDGLLQWVAYVVQIAFPVIAMIILVALIKDIRREYIIPYYEEQRANN